jgi:hypothetical protein
MQSWEPLSMNNPDWLPTCEAICAAPQLNQPKIMGTFLIGVVVSARPHYVETPLLKINHTIEVTCAPLQLAEAPIATRCLLAHYIRRSVKAEDTQGYASQRRIFKMTGWRLWLTRQILVLPCYSSKRCHNRATCVSFLGKIVYTRMCLPWPPFSLFLLYLNTLGCCNYVEHLQETPE